MAISPFATPPQSEHFWIVNARIPLTFLDSTVHYRQVIAELSAPPFCEEFVAADIEVRSNQITAIAPPGTAPVTVPTLDLAQGLVFPCFVDVHTHLDKGQSWSRTANIDGTFQSALQAIQQDVHHWSPEDLYRRIEFGLRCSYAHGTKAIRTHFDAFGKLSQTTLGVLSTLQEGWQDRLTIQAVSLVSLDYYLGPEGKALADQVADSGNILGGVAYFNPDLDTQLDRVFTLAAERNLAIDLHVDESLETQDVALRHIAQAKVRHRFSAPVVCGHACSLSIQSDEEVQETLRWVKEADIGIVSLPMCNLYLQDRHLKQTPRYRGVTLLHELKAADIPVAIASDNCRDAFYGYGDLDGLEVLNQSTRIAHLDRPIGDWPRAITWTPATFMGLSDAGRIGIGQPADLLLFKARTFNELFSRPQSDRVVIRQGRAIDTAVPDYRELDTLLSPDNKPATLGSHSDL
jgi:cytosine deaminase